jgi:glycogen synthase
VIPPGYDPDLFAVAAPDPFPDLGRPRIGYIGRIAPQKDVGTLISAFGRITGAGLHADRRRRPWPADRRTAGAGGGWTGPVHRLPAPRRIAAVLRHIDVLVLATRYEELPSALIEGMAAGLPVIASRVGGIPTLIDYGVNGPQVILGLWGSRTRPLVLAWAFMRLARTR